MQATTYFGPGILSLINGTAGNNIGADTRGTTWSVGDWNFDTSIGATILVWDAWQALDIDLEGWTGHKEDRTLAPLSVSLTRSGPYVYVFAPANGNDPSVRITEYVFATTEEIQHPEVVFNAEQDSSGPQTMGFKGSFIDPDKVIYGQWWAASEKTTLVGGNTARLLQVYDGDTFGSGELLACKKLYWYRWVRVNSTERIATDRYDFFMPAINVKMNMAFADVDGLSHIMALKRNIT